MFCFIFLGAHVILKLCSLLVISMIQRVLSRNSSFRLDNPTCFLHALPSDGFYAVNTF